MLTPARLLTTCLACALALVSACATDPGSGDGGTSDGTDLALAGAPDLAADLAAAPDLTGAGAALVKQRPYGFKIPKGYDPSKPTPLVILLHGYGADGATQDAYFHLSALADDRTFLYAFPDGTRDSGGSRYWNATDACCAFFGPAVDDVAYLNAIIDDVSAGYNVDAKRVYLVGHSNGGFMSHRMACDAAPRIAAIVSLAGANWKDVTRCKPASPVSILQVHGTLDATIHYNGGRAGDVTLAPEYPSAPDTASGWAKLDGCTGALAPTGMLLDLDTVLLGAETRVARQAGCPAGIGVELWTIEGGGHIPSLSSSWASTIYTFLASHPKP